MGKWNFTATASALVATLDDGSGRIKEYTGCEAHMGDERINILISGHFKTAFIFSQIGTIDGETPTDIYDAFDLISAIIPESGGGGSFVPSEHDLDEFQNENADPFARISDVGGATSTQSYSPDSFIVVGVLTSFAVPANTEVISVVSNDAPLDNALWSQTGTSISIPTAVNGDKLQFSGFTFSATPPSDAVFAASVNGQTGTVVLDADDVSDASTTNKFTTTAEKTIWNAKQSALGYTAENTANKSTTLDTDKASDTKYPSVKSVYDWAVGLFAPIITAANFGAFVNGLTGKTTPVDADFVGLMDSAASNVQKKVSWANIKTTLRAAFDLVYAPIASPTFTGTPAAPTAAVTVGSTQLATTQHVKDSLNYVTPEMYGAVGDGVTNDATAFQNCINAGKPILLDTKTYLINTSLTSGTLMYMQGTGYKSVLKTTANISILTINGDNNVIKNVTFLGNLSGASQRGISATGVVGLTTYRISNIVSECRFVNFNTDGIYTQYMVGLSTASQHQGALYVSDCVFSGCGYGFRADTRGEYNCLSNNVFYLCQVGVSFTGGNNNIVGGQITDCTTTGIEILSGANDGHSSCVGVKINHNAINVKCTHSLNWVFSACTFYAGNITLTGTGKTIFADCQFSMASNTLTITNSPAKFQGCEMAAVAGTYTLTGTAPVVTNTYSGTTLLTTPVA